MARTRIVASLLASVCISNAFSIPWTKRHEISNTASLERRANSASTIAAPLTIPPSQYWEGNDGPWSTFPFQIGTGAVGGLQNVRLLVSTAATAIWTIGGEGCPNDYTYNCPNSRGGLFLRNQSLTWTPDSIYQTGLEVNLGLDSSGYVGFDTATTGWQGSGAEVTEEHTVMWNMADPRYWIGVFGLNPRPTNLTDFNNPQTSFIQKTFNDKKIPSVSYGYTAGNQYRLDGVYGSLTLGGYDSNLFEKNDISFPFYEDISRDLSVNLQSVTADKGTPSDLLPDGSISIFIDSTVPEIWLPESACSAFEQAFGITYNTDIGRYLVSNSTRQQLLSQNPSITFTIGPDVRGGKTVDITLPYSAFDLQVGFPIIPNNFSGPSYYFPLQRAANDTQYTLGRTFLQEAYLVVDYERQNFTVSQCVWTQDAVSNQKIESIISPSLANSTSSTQMGDNAGLSTGAIAGVAVAGVVVIIAILGLILFFLRRKRNARKREAAELEAKEKAAAAKYDNSSPSLERPGRNELGGADVYEAPDSQRGYEMDSGRDDGRAKYGYSELDGEARLAEMQADNQIYEMPGSDTYEAGAGRASKPPEANGGWL